MREFNKWLRDENTNDDQPEGSSEEHTTESAFLSNADINVDWKEFDDASQDRAATESLVDPSISAINLYHHRWGIEGMQEIYERD